MADLRCPMCGRRNPVEAETCSNCGARLKPVSPATPPAASPPANTPEWMSDLRDDMMRNRPKTSMLPPEPPAPPPPSDQWLSKIPGTEPPRPASPAKPPASEPADWTARLSSQNPPAPEPPPAAESRDEEPVWLKRLRARRAQDEQVVQENPAAAPAPEEAPTDGMPDWLSKIRDRTAVENPPAAEDQSYLSTPMAPAGGASPFSSSPFTSEPPAESSIPDWLSPFAQSSPSPQPSGETDFPFGGPPQGYPPAAAGPKPPGRAGVTTPALGAEWQFPGESQANPEFPIPEMGGSPPAPAAGISPFEAGMEPMVAPSGEGDLPDWLADARQTANAVPEPEPEAPMEPIPDIGELLSPDALPEWLQKPKESATAAEPAEPAAPAAPPAPADNLEQGELPRWLEVMRPIQSVTVSSEDEERVESVGPLAGLRGVLSAEPVVAMPRRPGVMAGNIDALPSQMTAADLLRRMIIEPEVRAARKIARPRSAMPFIRRGIALALLLAAFFPLVGGVVFAQPAFLPEASLAAGGVVEGLPTDRPVLVAFEYDASAAPELETGATVLLAHLAQRGISVAVISTQPNGPALAADLLTYGGAEGASMPAIACNLGYLPGGATGLRSMAFNLLEAVPATGCDWSQPPLSLVKGVGDFSMFLVLATSPQSVRDWVEQVHTAAPNVPVVAVVSASSDALVYPYTQGNAPSIRGMVAGFSGAEAYGNRFLTMSPSGSAGLTFRWQAFGMGIVVSILLLVGGAVSSFLLGGLQKNRRAEE